MPFSPKKNDFPFRNIVFDMDGVLLDTERLTREAWIAAGKHMHLAAIEDVFRQCLGISYESSRIKFMEQYGSEVSYDGFRKRAEVMYLKLVRNVLPVKPGVQDILEWLHSEGWKIGLASSTRRESVLHSLTRTGLIEYFSAVICGDMVPKSKPEPDIYVAACAALHAEPATCYAVEDSKNGIKSAHAAGLRTILIPDLIEPDSEMRRLSSAVFPSMPAFHQWLRETSSPCLTLPAKSIPPDDEIIKTSK